MTDSRLLPSDLARYLDDYLRVRQVPDWKNALNGLQVDGKRTLRRLGVAVDASEQTIRDAIGQECDLLLVHHGLFWGGNRPVTGAFYRRLELLFASGMAVYAAHLPLDVHPEVGNNAVLARRLDLVPDGTFGRFEGIDIGVTASCDLERRELHARLEGVLEGPVRAIAGGREHLRRVGIVTGSGGSMIAQAVEAGLDALVSGEGSHHTYIDAMEAGLNLYYGGHYATETWGVRALAEHVAQRFGIDWRYLDAPTGL